MVVVIALVVMLRYADAVTDTVQRFLDRVRVAQEELARALADEDERADGEDEEPVGQRAAGGDAFRQLARALGVPCPDALVAIGDALAGGQVWCGPWELFDPKEAQDARAFLLRHAEDMPHLQARAQMLPLFSRDGDMLLLDRDGAIWPFSFSGAEDDGGAVARTLEELLARLLDGDVIFGGGRALSRRR